MIEPDVLRLTALPFFLVAAAFDQRTRLVPSALWIPPLAIGALALGLQPSAASEAAISVAVVGGVSLILHRAGSFGLADVKALVVVSVLFPVIPASAALDGWIPLFPLVVMFNAMLVSLVYPAALFARNARQGRWRRDMAAVVRVDPGDIEGVHGWELDTGEDVRECDPDGPVDVVPGVPYLVPLFVGIVVSLVVGDLTGLA